MNMGEATSGELDDMRKPELKKLEYCRLVGGEIRLIVYDDKKNKCCQTLTLLDPPVNEFVPYKKIAQRSFDRDEVINHYDWLEKNLDGIWKAIFDKGLSKSGNAGIIIAHGDKCYQYRDKLKSEGIPFHHGIAIYLLSYVKPYANEVRETDRGWVAPIDWVINNYRRFEEYLPRY